MRQKEGLDVEVRRALLLFIVAYIITLKGPLHGYGIRKWIELLTGWNPPETTVYSLLKRMEREGLIVGEWVRGKRTGALRKIYYPTDKIKELVESVRDELCSFLFKVVCSER